MKLVRAFLTVLFLAVVFAIGVGVGVFAPRWPGTGSHTTVISSAALLQQVQTLSQLVTVKYVMEKVVEVDDVKWSEWFGTSRVLLVAHGVVNAGVDLGRLAPGDVRIAGKKIVLTLPPARITDAYLDEKQTQVVERTTGLLRAFDKTLEQTARQQALDDLQRAARHNGILQDAEERARTQLASLFHRLGFDEVEFRERRPVFSGG